MIFVRQSALTELFAELTEFGAELSEFPLPKLGYLVTTRMGATRIGFSRPAGFDLGLRKSGVHISGPEFEISRPECLFCTVA